MFYTLTAAAEKDVNFAELLISAGYIVVVMALIFVILLLVDRYGRKNQQKKDKTEKSEDSSENITKDNDKNEQ